MDNYKEILNKTTGKKEFLFNAKLLNVSEHVLENSNEKAFRIVTLGFNLPSGEKVERTAICYESNYKYGIDIEKSYLTNLSFDAKGNPNLRMSHLVSTDRASKDDFAELYLLDQQLIEEDQVM